MFVSLSIKSDVGGKFFLTQRFSRALIFHVHSKHGLHLVYPLCWQILQKCTCSGLKVEINWNHADHFPYSVIFNLKIPIFLSLGSSPNSCSSEVQTFSSFTTAMLPHLATVIAWNLGVEKKSDVIEEKWWKIKLNRSYGGNYSPVQSNVRGQLDFVLKSDFALMPHLYLVSCLTSSVNVLRIAGSPGAISHQNFRLA